MYHICPTKCQIQFLARKAPDHRRFCLAEAAAGGGFELGDAIRRGLGGMDQADDGIAGKRRFDLAEAADDGARLAGERQGAGGGGQKQSIDTLRQARLDRGAALESAGEELPLLGQADMVGIGGDPDAAAGQATAKVGDDGAVRRDDETDQRVNRQGLPGDDAGPFGWRVAAGHAGLLITLRAPAWRRPPRLPPLRPRAPAD